MKLGWQYKDDELQVFKGVDDVPPVFRCNIMKSIDLADLARACGYGLVPLERMGAPVKAADKPTGFACAPQNIEAALKILNTPLPKPDDIHEEMKAALKRFDAAVDAGRKWSTAAINMGMPEEDFPTGHQWPFPTSNADLEEHIARSPEKDAAEYRIAVKKAIFRGPL